jgi:hypothetical protein
MKTLCYVVNRIREWHDDVCGAVTQAEEGNHDEALKYNRCFPCGLVRIVLDKIDKVCLAQTFAEEGEHEEAKKHLE